ncbi:hypothetical protein KGD82_08280 [Nocardiopsis eucommiae]|uniref:Uncharacterized protein n=1 Tax=Nocardiopsis eucommiae TaxID=2831970 RepID=A0A975LBJ3_9ACTN|nr:hypothetical protein KGD82_08280 [Nocardiopsis eucommiae]
MGPVDGDAGVHRARLQTNIVFMFLGRAKAHEQAASGAGKVVVTLV